MTEPYVHPLDDDVVADVWPRRCANCDRMVPSHLRWCSFRCWRQEDGGEA